MRSFLPSAATCLILVAGAGCAAEPPTQPERPLFINNGQPTGADYGAVGALLFDFDQSGTIEGDEQLCTGSLISSTVFLTAAHCVAWLPASAQLHVSFAPALLGGALSPIAATGFTYDPQYGHNNGDPHDLAVVRLPARAITPLSLPPAGYLDALAAQGGLRKVNFVNVGYGLAAARTGRPSGTWDGKRNWSLSPFQSLRPAWLSLLMATAATGLGGDCYGDSGGPKFLEGNATTIVATVSWGDRPCRAMSASYRLDTPAARAFLEQFVTLP